MTAYATLADFTSTFEVVPPASRNTRITAALEEASALIEGAIGWDFYQHPAASTEARLFDGGGGGRLCVHEGIVSLTTVEIRSSATDAWQAVPAADYVLEPQVLLTGESFGHVRLTGVGSYTTWPRGVTTVRLTGVFGYASVPVRVRRATVALARQIYRADASNVGGIAGPDELGGGIMPRGWPDDAYRCVEYYRRLYWCRV